MVVIHFDGACSPNGILPNKWGVGVAVFVNGVYNEFYSKQVSGVNGTNNTAEWEGLILALETIGLLELGNGKPQNILIKGDSQIVVNGFNKRRVTKEHLRPLLSRAIRAFNTIKGSVKVEWFSSKENTYADVLSTRALNGNMDRSMPTDKERKSSKSLHSKSKSKAEYAKAFYDSVKKQFQEEQDNWKDVFLTEVKIGDLTGQLMTHKKISEKSVLNHIKLKNGS